MRISDWSSDVCSSDLVLIVRVRLVELQHREFGIVARRESFITEVAVDLVNLLETANDQSLEEQFRRDAQIQIAIERVVMCHERPRRRAASDRLQHRRLDFDETEIGKAYGWERVLQ